MQILLNCLALGLTANYSEDVQLATIFVACDTNIPLLDNSAMSHTLNQICGEIGGIADADKESHVAEVADSQLEELKRCLEVVQQQVKQIERAKLVSQKIMKREICV